jgi:hypothetical protein
MRSTDMQDGHILKTLSAVIWTTWDHSNSGISGPGDELFTHATQELPLSCRSARLAQAPSVRPSALRNSQQGHT